MTGLRRNPTFASDDWMLEQQMRAELEAEAWRRLREALSPPPPAETRPQPRDEASAIAERVGQGGSLALKALVRFGLGAAAGYLCWLAAVDGGLGEFEIWLATGSGFLVALSLSMFGAARRLVHLLAETIRWALLAGLCVGAFWGLAHLAA